MVKGDVELQITLKYLFENVVNFKEALQEMKE